MKTSISISLLSLVLVTACGKSSDKDSAATSISSDTELSEASMSANFQDAMNAMSDSNAESGATSLALAPVLEVTRSCVAGDGKATVDVSSEFSLDTTIGGPNLSVAFKAENTIEIERVWSKDGASIACAANGKFAAIDPASDLSGLEAHISFKRSLSTSRTITNARKGTSKAQAAEISSEGTRTIHWDSQSEGSVFTRALTIASDSSHTVNVTKQSGIAVSLVFTMATDASAPLVIETEKESLLSTGIAARTIKSGKIVASTAGRGRVESVYEGLKVAFADDGCDVESGKVTLSVFAEGSATAALIYQVNVEAGVAVVTNVTDASNPVEVEDFALPVCDARNFDL